MAEITKISLVRTRSPRGRMYLIRDGKGLGAAGHPPGHYTWDWVIGCGVDRGAGYQGYIAVDYALTCEWVPEDAKATIRRTLNIPTIGERSICERCGQDLEWNGEAWHDRGADTTCGPYKGSDHEIVPEDHTKPHVPARTP